MRSRTSLVLKLLRQKSSPSGVFTLLAVRKALEGCRSVLDIGCGPASTLGLFGFERLVGIEGYAPSVETARQNRTHDELVLGDVRELERFFTPEQFDACVAIDVIEHITKEEGSKMLQQMERMAAKRVMLPAPNGFLFRGHPERADLQEHHFEWGTTETEYAGRGVRGMAGRRPCAANMAYSRGALAGCGPLVTDAVVPRICSGDALCEVEVNHAQAAHEYH